MSAENSIAMWCELAPEVDQTDAEFHVNLWRFSDPARKDFIELGIKPADPSVVSCVKIFLPFKVSRAEIEDLGPRFQNIEIAQGIFNEALSCTQSADAKCVELREDETVYCRVHIFSQDAVGIVEDELELRPLDYGTLLTITQPALMSLGSRSAEKQKGYFRLRIAPKDADISPFVTVIRPRDRAWHSGFEQIEYIDCRINEARTLPTPVEAAFRAANPGVARTREIVFLAVAPVVSAVTSSHSEWHKSRLLEREIWENYVPYGLEDGMVVYHWKKTFDVIKDKRFASFSAFVKMQTRKSGGRVIALYVSLAFFFGVLGSLAASALLFMIGGS